MTKYVNRQIDGWKDGWMDGKPKERMSNINTIKTWALVNHIATNGIQAISN